MKSAICGASRDECNIKQVALNVEAASFLVHCEVVHCCLLRQPEVQAKQGGSEENLFC